MLCYFAFFTLNFALDLAKRRNMLTKEQKEEVIQDVRLHKGDTGSAEAQIALLSEEIKDLLQHFKKHPKDQHSRYGLLKMVIKRKKLLKYLEKEDKKRYNAIIKKVGLKDKTEK